MRNLLKTATPLRLHILGKIFEYFQTTDDLLEQIDDWQDSTWFLYECRPKWSEMADKYQSYEPLTCLDDIDTSNCSDELLQMHEFLDGMIYTEIDLLLKWFENMGQHLDSNYHVLKSEYISFIQKQNK